MNKNVNVKYVVWYIPIYECFRSQKGMLEHKYNDAKWHSTAYNQQQWIILFGQMGFGFDHHSKDSCLLRGTTEPDITWFTKPVFTSSHYSISEQKWHDLIYRTNMQTHFTRPLMRSGHLTQTHLQLYLRAALGNLVLNLQEDGSPNTCEAMQNKQHYESPLTPVSHLHRCECVFVNLSCAAKPGHWHKPSQSNICVDHQVMIQWKTIINFH